MGENVGWIDKSSPSAGAGGMETVQYRRFRGRERRLDMACWYSPNGSSPGRDMVDSGSRQQIDPMVPTASGGKSVMDAAPPVGRGAEGNRA